MNGNGWRKTTRRRRTSKKPRLTGVQRKIAEAEGGGSASARMVAEMERRIASEMNLNIQHPIKCKGKDWYLYNGVKWERTDKECFLPIAWDVQELNNRNPRRDIEVMNALEHQRQLGRKEKLNGAMLVEGDGTYLLNFLNGTLKIDIETGKILDCLSHNPAHMFTLSLGKYIADSDCLFFKKILREILPNKRDRKLFLNFFTSALLPDSRFESCLLCIGRGANGKSVITEAMANALREDVCSHLTLHQICANDRKQMHRLEFKMLNVANETDTSIIKDTSTFKSIISGEGFTTEMLYEKHGFEMHTTAKMCFLMNDMPPIKHATEGDLRRAYAIHFPVQFSAEHRDLFLRSKLKAEADGILAYLIRRQPGLCALDELPHGGFASRKIEEHFRGSSDLVAAFCDQCLQKGPTHKAIAKENIYNCFRKFCKRRDRSVQIGNSKFFFILRKFFPDPEINFDYCYNAGKLGRMYSVKGLTFSTNGFDLLYDDL